MSRDYLGTYLLVVLTLIVAVFIFSYLQGYLSVWLPYRRSRKAADRRYQHLPEQKEKKTGGKAP